MFSSWSVSRKIGAGFLLSTALTLVIASIGVATLRRVVARKDRVLAGAAQGLRDAQVLAVAAARKSSSIRGYLLSQEQRQIELINERRKLFLDTLPRMKTQLEDADATRVLAAAERIEAEHEAAAQRLIEMRRSGVAMDVILNTFEADVQPKLDALTRSLDQFTAIRERALRAETQAASDDAARAGELITEIGALAIGFGLLFGMLLARTLSRQIGAAVGNVRTSSNQLHSAANQHASASKEQALAMSEISMTMTELLASSRQIASGARRVSEIATSTASAARTGDATVERASGSLTELRAQVEAMLGRMLALGKKSQQVGAVVEFVRDLAEQTNILAINATIEAQGSSEAGKRFAVVADEIRKLAARVGLSTKEISALLGDVRTSLDETIAATEKGFRAMDAGTKSFSEVTRGFSRIAEMITLSTDAAREIELSTQQQATAVEQVMSAVTSVARATQDSEASASTTLETASSLNDLSRVLVRLIRPNAA